MNTIIFPWGPFTISVYSLSFSVAIVVGLIAVIVAGWRARLSFQLIIDYVLISLLCGVVGGRLAHILFTDREFYFQQPEQILRLQDGGISFWGGFLLALILVVVWAGRRRQALLPFLDAAAPALALGLAMGTIGYPLQGRAMSEPYAWGLAQEGGMVHPDGAYAIVLLMLLFYYLIYRRRRVHYQGEPLLLFTAGYGFITLVVDCFRDFPTVWWRFSAGQVISLIMIFLVVFYMIGGPKTYSSRYYFNRKIDRSSPSRVRVLFQLLGGIMLIALQLYLYFIVNGFPAGLTDRLPLWFPFYF